MATSSRSSPKQCVACSTAFVLHHPGVNGDHLPKCSTVLHRASEEMRPECSCSSWVSRFSPQLYLHSGGSGGLVFPAVSSDFQRLITSTRHWTRKRLGTCTRGSVRRMCTVQIAESVPTSIITSSWQLTRSPGHPQKTESEEKKH